MPGGVSLAVLTAFLGLLSAAILAVVNNWINVRAGVDEDLRTQRLRVYPTLWIATGAVSRWPRTDISRSRLEDLHRDFRSWYFSEGGLFLSASSRARYGDLQELIDALLQGGGNPEDLLGSAGYTDLMETASALRTAMTEDLDTRRKKSFWEARRRSKWHTAQEGEVQARIARVVEGGDSFVSPRSPAGSG
ncbi:MAG TPA: hypothetical protein VFP89_03295 [Propionibacteriaceae bacterium]|nr:hypothetical protein [Propionibacteriaceae bacterium]